MKTGKISIGAVVAITLLSIAVVILGSYTVAAYFGDQLTPKKVYPYNVLYDPYARKAELFEYVQDTRYDLIVLSERQALDLQESAMDLLTDGSLVLFLGMTPDTVAESCGIDRWSFGDDGLFDAVGLSIEPNGAFHHWEFQGEYTSGDMKPETVERIIENVKECMQRNGF
ncbi:MAG: hypothetical protein J1E60_02655 [Christensenellaceae bacterium]|nr:hypothetical protein [Christensenellaceae bacterium]